MPLAREGVRAKGKVRRSEIEDDKEALAEFEAKMLVPIKKDTQTRHRDDIPAAEIINIMADEIEAVVEETGGRIDRLNAREFYAMNIVRSLLLKHHVSAREKEVPMVKCKEHS